MWKNGNNAYQRHTDTLSQPVLFCIWSCYFVGETWGNWEGLTRGMGGCSSSGRQPPEVWMFCFSWFFCFVLFFSQGVRAVLEWGVSPGREGLELLLSVQHTSFPAAPAGRMLSWVSWAECSLALRRSAAILEALRSAAAEEDDEEEAEEGSGRTEPAWEGFSTGGAGWRRRAAAVEALVRGPILENSLKEDQSSTI